MQEYEDKFCDVYHENIDWLYSELQEWIKCKFERIYLLDLMNQRNFFNFCVNYSELYVEEYEDVIDNDLECDELENGFTNETNLVLKKIEKPTKIKLPIPQGSGWVILKRGR